MPAGSHFFHRWEEHHGSFRYCCRKRKWDEDSPPRQTEAYEDNSLDDASIGPSKVEAGLARAHAVYLFAGLGTCIQLCNANKRSAWDYADRRVHGFERGVDQPDVCV